MALLDDLKAAGIKPSAVEAKPEGFAASPVVSAAAGFNQGVENVTLGTVQLATRIADKVLGTDMTSSVGSVKAELERQENVFKKTNPTTFAVGKGVGSIAATAPTLMIPGAGQSNMVRLGSQGLAQGAIAGALMYTDDGSVTSHLTNAVMGGVVGGAVGGAVGAVQSTVKGAMNAASTYLRGVNAGKDAAKTFVDDVTTGMAAKISPNNPDVTAKHVLDQVNKSFDKVKSVNDANYLARDQAALKSGVGVMTDTTNNTIKEIQKGLGVRMNSDDKALLNIVKSYGGDKPITLGESYNLLKKAGNARQSALATDPSKARLIGQVQDALQLDIDKAVEGSGNRIVQDLHNNAQNFYKETYLPIKEVAKSKAVDKLTEDAWITKIVNDSKGSSYTNTGLDQIGGDIRNEIAGAHMNAVKANLTDPITGELDFHGYISAFNRDLLKNPALKKTADEIGNLSKVVDVVKKATMERGQGLSNMLGAGTGFASGSVAAGGATWLLGQVPKAKAMYMLGKVTTDPVVKSLLSASKNIDTIAEPLQKALTMKILGHIGSIANSKMMNNLGSASAIGTALALGPSNKGVNTVHPNIEQAPVSTIGGIRG